MIFKHTFFTLSIVLSQIWEERGRYFMLCGYSVSYCETNCKHWTPAAVDCYLIGCNCSKCNINKIYFSNSDFKCVMKSTVIELVRKLGTPDLEGEKNV